MGTADTDAKAGASAFEARPDNHIDTSGARVPTPDPKDQTGDPDEANPAMAELRKRKRGRPNGGSR